MKDLLIDWLNDIPHKHITYKFQEKPFKRFQPDWYKLIMEFKIEHNLEHLKFSNILYNYIHDITTKPVCDNGNERKFLNYKLGYNRFCQDLKCSVCRTKKQDQLKETFLKKYGVDNPMKVPEIQKKVETYMINKYGVKNAYQSAEIKEKIKKTNQKNLGVDYPMQSKEVLEKSKKTVNEKWGVDYYSQTADWREKCIITSQKNYGADHAMKSPEYYQEHINRCIDKWGVAYYAQTDEYKIKYSNTVFKRIQKRYPDVISFDHDTRKFEIACHSCYCGKNSYQTNIGLYKQRLVSNTEPCLVINPLKEGWSSHENNVYNYIISLGVDETDIIRNDRNLLNGKEIDMYLPKYGFAIEFNGIYWHSEIFKDRMYHADKSIGLMQKGIDLFHIWEDDWVNKMSIVQTMIKSKLGLVSNKISASKCQIREIDRGVANEFLDKNHIQGGVESSIELGLFYRDELLEVMTFGKIDTGDSESGYEILRFATCLDRFVDGGFSKLLIRFNQIYRPVKLTAVSKFDYSMDNVYQRSGFSLDSVSVPNYRWVYNDFEKDSVYKNLTSSQVIESDETLIDEGWYRVWDSGNLEYSVSLSYM